MEKISYLERFINGDLLVGGNVGSLESIQKVLNELSDYGYKHSTMCMHYLYLVCPYKDSKMIYGTNIKDGVDTMWALTFYEKILQEKRAIEEDATKEKFKDTPYEFYNKIKMANLEKTESLCSNCELYENYLDNCPFGKTLFINLTQKGIDTAVIKCEHFKLKIEEKVETER